MDDKRLHEQSLEIIRHLCLFDDEFMRIVFDNNIEATELVLNIILDRDDLKVKKVIGQREIKGIEGHSVRLDIDTPLGKLVHDFKCKEVNDMYYEALTKRVRHLKEEAKGESKMTKARELINQLAKEMVAEEKQEVSIQSAIETGRRYGATDAQILSDIMQEYSLTEQAAREYMFQKTA